MTQEALKLALEAHKKNERHNTVAETRYWCDQYKLLAEQALAQPEQEPVATVESVATVVSELGNQEVTMSWWHEPALPVGTKLYTTPPKRTWVGLTFAEICECESEYANVFARNIEAKLKELNT